MLKKNLLLRHPYKESDFWKKIFKGIKEVSMNEIADWINSYVSPRTCRLLGAHGKSNYLTAVKWLFKHSELVSLP
ncbi:MAG: hypothetical protein ACFFAN_16590 [Promethearchaeota archaeon]